MFVSGIINWHKPKMKVIIMSEANKNVSTPVDVIVELIELGKKVLSTHTPNPPGVIGFTTLDTGQFQGWRTQCNAFLVRQLGSENEYTTGFKAQVKSGYRSAAESGIKILEALKADFEQGHILAHDADAPLDVLATITLLTERFHLVARQLRSRHAQRPTLDIDDEYDVQDLLHALLKIFFEDVRAEEWTPTYAGGASRMDFLLKNEQVVIEVKKTRKSMSVSDVGGQLLVDISRYQSHPDCGALLCFVYDPEGLLPNPRGVEKDLSKDGDFPVRVFIRP